MATKITKTSDPKKWKEEGTSTLLQVKIVNRRLNHLEHILTFKQDCTHVMFANQNSSQLTSPMIKFKYTYVKRIC
jgi:hypothetical protein